MVIFVIDINVTEGQKWTKKKKKRMWGLKHKSLQHIFDLVFSCDLDKVTEDLPEDF